VAGTAMGEIAGCKELSMLGGIQNRGFQPFPRYSTARERSLEGPDRSPIRPWKALSHLRIASPGLASQRERVLHREGCLRSIFVDFVPRDRKRYRRSLARACRVRGDGRAPAIVPQVVDEDLASARTLRNRIDEALRIFAHDEMRERARE